MYLCLCLGVCNIGNNLFDVCVCQLYCVCVSVCRAYSTVYSLVGVLCVEYPIIGCGSLVGPLSWCVKECREYNTGIIT